MEDYASINQQGDERKMPLISEAEPKPSPSPQKDVLLAPNLYQSSLPRRSVFQSKLKNEQKVRSGIKLEISDNEMTDGGTVSEGERNDVLKPLRSAVSQTTHFNPKFGSTPKYSDRLLSPLRAGRLDSHDFPGFGGAFMLRAPVDQLDAITESQQQREKHAKLGEWLTTAICGNDILSSCLYVSGVVTADAGILSPVCLLVVAGILYLMRFVYGEAITALPINGGSYNVLINTTNKAIASLAACLAIISYIATGVVSGTSAIQYFKTVVPGLDVVTSTIVLLFVFAVLAFLGISESAVVALTMFITHVVTLTLLCLFSLVFFLNDQSIWLDNWENRSFPDIIVAGSLVSGTIFTSLFFGLASAMLGVSGFESASQYVQEQAQGVFVKCLRNMWWFVAVFNPLISFLSFCTLTFDDIKRDENHVLSSMAYSIGAKMQSFFGVEAPLGQFFNAWVALDAFVVLSGAVLTSYVGVNGLIRRMAADRVLPQFLLRVNKWRGTNHYIIFGYFILSTSQILLLQGDTVALAGVYTFAFMGVMCIFTIGTMMLKAKRIRLPREVNAPWVFCALALVLLLAALVGNILGKPAILSYFFLYFAGVGLVILLMFQRLNLAKAVFNLWKKMFKGSRLPWLREAMQRMTDTPYVFFCKYDDLYQLNKAILYVRKNEVTSHLLIINVCSADVPEPEELPEHIEMFDLMYPKLKISLLTVVGDFGPALIEWLSVQLQIPQNMMFITCPDDQFNHKIASLGGVRVISH